jgi:hypothetical protein
VSGIIACFGNANTIYNGSLHAITSGGDTGYSTQGTPFGSLTPSSSLLVSIYDQGASNSFVQIASASNPGQSFFSSVHANGAAFISSAATYSYAGGIATWEWSGAGQFNFGNGNNYPLIIYN